MFLLKSLSPKEADMTKHLSDTTEATQWEIIQLLEACYDARSVGR